ncbi:hypothetical protein [Kribbella sp. VKM Ac-2568]|uniref:hypothetical protein n=1 Tax=Kribbella sp. VKM Ac-2568 TaxID=2512219 RepID=UPI00104E8B99|nr:hypothetical protein [Kribbella sp. VKM Ac-2568]TCM42767.1 hypothetical protein EV648_110308 [Kribbella sp. VKM Ac-2568]
MRDVVVMGDDAQVRSYLANLPRWALALATGLPFGIAIAVTLKIAGPEGWTAAAVGGLIGAVAFGLPVAFAIDMRRRMVRAAIGDLPADKSKAARRAVDRGPIPADPETRAAALRLAAEQLHRFRRVHKLTVALGVLLLISGVGQVVTTSAWHSSNILFALVWLWGLWYWPKRLHRRIELLSEATNEP